MARLISIASAKGGVGKTTAATNLAAALAGFDKRVLLVDANLTTPNVGIHLGIPLYPVTLHDVLRGEATINEAIYEHASGFSVVPASISFDSMRGVNVDSMAEILGTLSHPCDFVIMDCAAGLGKEARAGMEASDEMLIVTNPELPAVADALKAVKIANSQGVRVLGAVVNRVERKGHELTKEEIEDMLAVPVLGTVPEDVWVKRSILARTPVTHFKPGAPASIEFKRLAASLADIDYSPPLFHSIGKLFSWLK